VSNKVKICISIVCLLIATNICGIPPGQCAAAAADITEETLWINLEVSEQQKKQIDTIILEAYSQVKRIEKNQKSTDLYNFNNIFVLLQYTSKMNDIRKNTSDSIMQILNTQQRNVFEDQLEQVQATSRKSTAMMLSLDLTDNQKKLIVVSLLKTQKKIWSTIANQSSSWEQKRKKLNRINKLQIISAKLSKDQRTMMAQWNVMFPADLN